MKKHLLIILILVFGTALRFYNNTTISLWHDEAFSALLIKYPWGEMMYRIGLDVHPPMYYILLRFWHYVFGDSLLALRSMSIFFGVGTIFAGYLFVKEAFRSEKTALWAAFLVAVSPFQLEYVTEARMYTMGAFFAVLASYFLVKALRQQKQLNEDAGLNMPNLPQDLRLKRQMAFNYLWFALSMIVIVLTHYYLLFVAAAIGLYGLVYLFFHHKWDWKKYLWLVGSFAVIKLSFLVFWLKVFLYQYRQVGEGYWIPKMDIWSVPGTLWEMLLGIGFDVNNQTTRLMLLVVTVFSLYFLYRFLKKTQEFEKWLVLLVILAPFGGALLFALMAWLKGSSSSVYLVRYFLFVSAFYTIALAVWLSQIKIKKIAFILFLFYAGVNLAAFVNYWQDLDVDTKPGMAAASKFIASNVEPNHKVYVGSSFMYFNLKYYINRAQGDFKTGATTTAMGEPVGNLPRPQLFTAGERFAKNISHFAGSAILTDEDLLPNFAESVKSGDTVWLVWTNGFGASKPDVPGNWTKIDEKGYAEVRPYVGTWVVVTEYKVN